MTVTVLYNGIEFEVEGTWTPEYGASLYEPEGGGFEVEDILLGDVSVCDILSQKADDDICELAYEEAREQVMGGYYD